MSGKVFKHSFSSEGNFLAAGVPIADKDIRPFMMKYIVKENKPSSLKREVNALKQWNTPYYVDDDNRLTMPARRAVAELEAQNAEQDYIDALSNESPDEVTQAMLEEMREDHAAYIQRQMANAKVVAQRKDELDDDVIQKDEAKVEAGEFNDMDVDLKPPPAKVKESEPRPARVTGQKLFVKRNGKFVRAHDIELVQGEPLYRHRPRSIGMSERFIKHAVVK